MSSQRAIGDGEDSPGVSQNFLQLTDTYKDLRKLMKLVLKKQNDVVLGCSNSAAEPEFSCLASDTKKAVLALRKCFLGVSKLLETIARISSADEREACSNIETAIAQVSVESDVNVRKRQRPNEDDDEPACSIPKKFVSNSHTGFDAQILQVSYASEEIRNCDDEVPNQWVTNKDNMKVEQCDEAEDDSLMNMLPESGETRMSPLVNSLQASNNFSDETRFDVEVSPSRSNILSEGESNILNVGIAENTNNDSTDGAISNDDKIEKSSGTQADFLDSDFDDVDNQEETSDFDDVDNQEETEKNQLTNINNVDTSQAPKTTEIGQDESSSGGSDNGSKSLNSNETMISGVQDLSREKEVDESQKEVPQEMNSYVFSSEKNCEKMSSSEFTQTKQTMNEWNNDLYRRKCSNMDPRDEERMIEKARMTYNQKPKAKHPYEDRSSDSEGDNHSSRRTFKRGSCTSNSFTSSDESDTGTKKRMRKRRRAMNFVLSEVEEERSSHSYTTPVKGRKNIREIMSDEELDEKTRKIGKEEEARKKRVKERQVLLNGTKAQESSNKLVLDYDAETMEELIVVHPKIVEKLKPHQVEGIKFMYNACYESVKQAEVGRGGGCILAHCMGLGKSFQIVALVHTLLSTKKIRAHTVLVLCPLTTVINWIAEFDKWLADVENKNDIKIYDLQQYKQNAVRADYLTNWARKGGVMILGYDMFRSLVNLDTKKVKDVHVKQIRAALLDPGPDLVVCDEGHKLKNENSGISIATMSIKTRRRIVLTGTPLQNNLNEYHCMIQFVKFNLLGSKKEFQNRFVNPISNGQFKDSNPGDVELMRKRSHVLNREVDGIVQRFDFSVLRPFLEPKYEYVITICLSDLQAKLYKYYIENKTSVTDSGKTACLFADYQSLLLLWNHPLTLKLAAEIQTKKQKKKYAGDGENDLSLIENSWWRKFVTNAALEDLTCGPKMLLLLAIVQQCQKIGEKLLIFSSSIPSLDMIEYFLKKKEFGAWKKDLDYFRFDGSIPYQLRAKYCKSFNQPDNLRGRLFLMSTKAGSLGINLTAANRVIIFNASWNPADDSQSIYRAYRLGQTKPCYIYRFVSQGTMEEKIYERQVTKLSVACRVVDEKQIQRHYYEKNIRELYTFERKYATGEVFKVPEDRVLAELLEQQRNIIVSYHEHDTLLENIDEEELTEEEQLTAMRNYEDERDLAHEKRTPTARNQAVPKSEEIPLDDHLTLTKGVSSATLTTEFSDALDDVENDGPASLQMEVLNATLATELSNALNDVENYGPTSLQMEVSNATVLDDDESYDPAILPMEVSENVDPTILPKEVSENSDQIENPMEFETGRSDSTVSAMNMSVSQCQSLSNEPETVPSMLFSSFIADSPMCGLKDSKIEVEFQSAKLPSEGEEVLDDTENYDPVTLPMEVSENVVPATLSKENSDHVENPVEFKTGMSDSTVSAMEMSDRQCQLLSNEPETVPIMLFSSFMADSPMCGLKDSKIEAEFQTAKLPSEGEDVLDDTENYDPVTLPMEVSENVAPATLPKEVSENSDHVVNPVEFETGMSGSTVSAMEMSDPQCQSLPNEPETVPIMLFSSFMADSPMCGLKDSKIEVEFQTAKLPSEGEELVRQCRWW